MNIIKITSLDHPGLEPYAKLTDKQMRNVLHPADAIIVVESPKVITTALNAGCEPLSLLCEQRHIEGDAKDILARVGDIPVFTRQP